MGIKTYLRRNKEGIIGGGAIGVFVGFYYLKYQNINPFRAMMMDTSGLLDKALSYMPKEDLATLKVILLFMILGIIGGALIDSIWRPRK